MDSAGGHREPSKCSRRAVIGAIPAAAMLAAVSRDADSAENADIIVAPDDTGVHSPIVAALAQAAHLGRPARIALMPGTYREKLRIAVPGVTLFGLGEGVVIAFGAAAGLARPEGGKWGTAGSATLTVDAPGVTLRRVTIRNDFDYVADTRTHASGGAQAVALAIGRDADRTSVEGCAVEGYQDTLYVAARALFRRCRIAGGVDFIFGGAAALFRDCTIVTRHVPGAEGGGYVAAPSTLAVQRFGLVFDRCHVTREAGVPDRSTYLGRPWRAGGNMAILGAAAFLRCRLDAHIRADGWTAMGFTDPAGVRRMLEPQEARLFEWRSTGPGAAPASPTRRHLTDAQAAAFRADIILQGWAS